MKVVRNPIHVIALVCLVVAGCVQLGLTQPKNTEQSIAYVYPAVGAVADAARIALREGKINKAEAQVVVEYGERVVLTANIARNYFRAGDISAAERNLSLAKSVLREARRYIGLPEDKELN